MKIVNIHVKEFGALKDRSFDLSDTLTIIRGDNESGKSTLLLFIKFMLYGLAKKQRGALVSEADRALSRDSSNAAGSMTLEYGGRLYKIERRAYRSSKNIVDKLQVIELESSLPYTVPDSPGEFFLGVPCDVFESSCHISQLGSANVGGTQTGSAIQNLLSNADETVDAQKTLKLLEAARVKYLHKNEKGGSIYELEGRLDALEGQYTRAIEDNCETERLGTELAKLDEKIADIAAKQHIADELFSKINLRAAVRLFDKLHEYERRLSDEESELSLRTAEIKKNGFVPDRAFLASLKNVSLEMDIAKKELFIEKKELDELRSAGEDEKTLAALEKIESEGGIDALDQRCKKTGSKIRTMGALSLVCASLCVLSAAIGIIFFASALTFAACASLAALLLVFAILSLGAKAKNKKALDAIYAEYNSDKASFDAFLASCELAIAKRDERKEQIQSCEATVKIKERLLDSSVARLKETVGVYSEIDTDDFKSAYLTLCELIEKIEGWCDFEQKAKSHISTLKERIDELSRELSEYNEHQTRRRISSEILAMSDDDIQKAKREKHFLDHQLKALTERKTTLERTLMERKYSTKDPFDIAAEMAELSGEISRQRKIYDAVALAIDSISTASVNMRNTLAPRLHALAGNYISKLTSKKYETLGVSEDLELSMTEDGFSYPVDAFSTGTKDAAYISLRLALLNVLASENGEPIPLFMDESAAMIDDKRTLNLLSLLSDYCNGGGQCLLFSCHDREEKLCENNGIPYKSMVL